MPSPRLLLLLFVSAPFAAEPFALAQTPPAFPGAEGFGAVATGGRGGRVVYVTNLNADGPGSFQDALDQEGPRYILFAVSGRIDASVQLTRGDVTIAGQTSPGGILVRQLHTTEEPYCDHDLACISLPTTRHAENVILRHLRFRPAGAADDGLRLRYTRRTMVDHVSVGNAEDEAIEITYSADVTVQNTLLAETVGDHADRGGMLLNYANAAAGFGLDGIAVLRSSWNRMGGRLPELSRESAAAAGTTTRLEISNNLLWDPGHYVDVNATTLSGDTGAPPVYYALNWVGNAGYTRPDFPFGMMSFPVNVPNLSTTYFAGNRLDLYPARRDYQLLYCCNDYPATVADPGALPYPDPGAPPAFARATRHPFPPVTYLDGANVREHIARNVGAFPRDPMDRRLLAPLSTGVIDPAPRNVNPYGDALLVDAPPPPPPLDTDLDGMPDAWELSHGLNPALQDHNGTGLSVALTGVAGYTNLECYLDELSDRLVASGSPLSLTAASGVSRARGESATSTIAAVSGALSASVLTSPPGLSVTGLSISGGSLTATVAASCSATLGANAVGLRVTDGTSTVDAQLTVSVSPNVTPPSVTPPGPGTTFVSQTGCTSGGGATLDELAVRFPAERAALLAVLNGGSASDDCSPSPLRLAPLLLGAPVTGSTRFPVGPSSIQVRFQDGDGNVSSAAASVVVRRQGDVTADGAVDLFDLVTVAGYLVGNLSAGLPPFVSPASTSDHDGDGDVDILDLVRAASHVVGNVGCLVP